MIEEILKDLFDQPEIWSKEKINEIIHDLNALFSGESYEQFLKSDVSDARVKKTILSNFEHLFGAVMLPTPVLTETSPDLRKRIAAYLDNLLEKITKIISEEKSRILNAQNPEESSKKSEESSKTPEKKLEEMSNDELIDYLFSKLGK